MLCRLERQVLRTLGENLQGRPSDGPPLTSADYGRAVVGLSARGLVAADVRMIRDDPDHGPIPDVIRVWLTTDGRAYLGQVGT